MIAVCGEALIDLVERDGVLDPIPGGGPFNTAVGLGKLGAPVAFVGAISQDRFGDVLVGCLEDAGVDTRHVLRRPVPTPLALVQTTERGENEFSFYLAATAYADVSPADLPELAPEILALHLGTLALAIDPPAATFELFLRRESSRRVIVIDPNVRPDVFGDRAEYRSRFDAWTALAHVVKLSDDDAAWLYPGRSHDEVLDAVLEGGAALVALTLGSEGAVLRSRAGEARRASVPVEVVDTVGAGDAFSAALLRWLWANGQLEPATIARLASAELGEALDFAVAVSSLQCTRTGATCPTLAEVEEFMAA